MASGPGSWRAKSPAASSKDLTTDSVMRSWIASTSARSVFSRIAFPFFIAKCQATPRSSRITFASPQLCAMSVAFEDHGDTVPKRGSTTRSSPFGPPAPGVP